MRPPLTPQTTLGTLAWAFAAGTFLCGMAGLISGGKPVEVKLTTTPSCTAKGETQSGITCPLNPR